MAITKKELEKKILAELQGIVRDAEKNIRKEEVEGIGKKVIRQMIDRISVGISPIRGDGRFPAYKAAGSLNDINKEARKIDDPKRRAAFKKALTKQAKRGYPYSVQKEFPGKQVRPVNLRLSGKFLLDLEAVGQILPGKVRLLIGFTEPESVKKELGHREGANGQPQRPIIPVGDERFTPEIEKTMFDSFSALLARAYARVKRR